MDSISFCHFSPDGKMLFVRNRENTNVTLWHLESDLKFPVETPGIEEFFISPNSDLLVRRIHKRLLGVWPIGVDALIATAKATSGRELSNEEKSYFQIQNLSNTDVGWDEHLNIK